MVNGMRKSVFIYIVLVCSVIVFHFQNCSEVQFKTQDPSGLADGNGQQSLPPTTPQPNTPDNVSTLFTVGDWASVAYEDNIDNPNGGDRDYNDAVFNYKISEEYNANNKLAKISIIVKIREKISSANHRLFLYLNGDTGEDFSNIRYVSLAAMNGKAKITLTKPDGQVIDYTDADHLVVVDATTGNKGKEYRVEVVLNNPELNPRNMSVNYINFKKYRFILQNFGSRKGIDIVEINPSGEMISSATLYPLGFMIPTDWNPPAEGQLIDNLYPNFVKYRSWIVDPMRGPITDEIFYWFL